MAVVDVCSGKEEIDSLGESIFFSRKDVLSCYFESVGQAATLLPDDRGEAIAIMSKALEHFLEKTHEDGVVALPLVLEAVEGRLLYHPSSEFFRLENHHVNSS